MPVGYLATSGTTILASQHNPPLEDIGEALTARLSRDGSAPMTAALKLASGAVGAPGAVFSVDATSGLYKTTGGIGVAIGGVQVAEFLAGGIKGARFIGELIPWTLTAPAPLCVLPYGQTLSRAAFPDLWVVAQIEIAAGSLLYNNGDGSTTFGILDLRGRTLVCNDGIGGVHANRTTTLTPNGITNGAVGGVEQSTLLTANLPPYTPAGTVSGSITGLASNGQVRVGALGVDYVVGTIQNGTVDGRGYAVTGTFSGSITGGTPQGGTSTPLTNMPPSIITNYILFAGA